MFRFLRFLAFANSPTAHCDCCWLVHVPTRDARDFARLLRTISRSGRRWQPEAVLDISDERTLRKVLVRAALREIGMCTPTPQQFLARQRWIPTGNLGLVALQQLLSAGPDAMRE